MKLNRWFMVSLITLIVGCAGQATKNQALEPSAAPTAIASPTTSIAQSMQSATTLKTGQFLSGEHTTQGTARIVVQNGKTFLTFDQTFRTSENGPDLVVILHRSANVLGTTKAPAYPLKEGDYVFLAPLQKFSGAQQYAIPAKINLAEYNSAVIWCRKFNATFGAAPLSL